MLACRRLARNCARPLAARALTVCPPPPPSERRYAELAQRLLHEVAVPLRYQLAEVHGGAFGGHLHRHDDIDAVGSLPG
jgi:hypothetical protein